MASWLNFVNWYISSSQKPKTCPENLKTDGVRVFGWDVMSDQASTSLGRTVVFFECRRLGRRHRWASLELPVSPCQGRATTDHRHLRGNMVKLLRPMPNTHRRMLSQRPFDHGRSTKAISPSMGPLLDAQDARLFSPTRHLNRIQ